jgi:hypothetical protein
VESDLDSKEMAARDVIQKVLSTAGKNDGTPPLFNKILARWVTETDLGAMKRLEFTGISSEDFQKIQTDFADTEKISAVWPREFDSQGISVLDVETRLDNIGLGQEVTKATSGRAKLDRSTENSSPSTRADRNPFRIRLRETGKATRKATTSPGGKCGRIYFKISATARRRNGPRTMSRANMANSSKIQSQPVRQSIRDKLSRVENDSCRHANCP